MNELHHVVVPADVAFEDFARTGVVHVGAIGVLDGRGEVADDRVAGVLHAHGGVVLRPFQGVNRVFEPGFLESHLPVVDALDEVLAPLLGRSGVDVVNDGLLRLDELTALHLLGVGRVFRFEAPARDETARLDALLVVGEVGVAVSEITDARVEIASQHGLFRQQDERHVQTDGGAARGAGGDEFGRGSAGECLGRADLGVEGERLYRVDVRLVCQHGRQSPLAFIIGRKADSDVVIVEKLGDVDFILAASRRFYLKGTDDGVFVADDDSLVDGVGRIGRIDEQVGAQKECLARRRFLPVNSLLVYLLAGKLTAVRGRRREARCGQELTPDERIGHFEEPVVSTLRHVEESLARNILGFGDGGRFVCLFFLFPCIGRDSDNQAGREH